MKFFNSQKNHVLKKMLREFNFKAYSRFNFEGVFSMLEIHGKNCMKKFNNETENKEECRKKWKKNVVNYSLENLQRNKICQFECTFFGRKCIPRANVVNWNFVKLNINIFTHGELNEEYWEPMSSNKFYFFRQTQLVKFKFLYKTENRFI